MVIDSEAARAPTEMDVLSTLIDETGSSPLDGKYGSQSSNGLSVQAAKAANNVTISMFEYRLMISSSLYSLQLTINCSLINYGQTARTGKP